MLKHWRVVAVVGGVLLVVFFWWLDRRGQFDLGVSEERLQIEKSINESKELTNVEKDRALRAARDAAFSVCEREGLSAADCKDL